MDPQCTFLIQVHLLWNFMLLLHSSGSKIFMLYSVRGTLPYFCLQDQFATRWQTAKEMIHPSKQTVVDYFTQVVAEIWFMKFGTCKLNFGLVKNLLLFQSEEPLWPLFDWLTENMFPNTFPPGLSLQLFCLLILKTWVLIVKYFSSSWY